MPDDKQQGDNSRMNPDEILSRIGLSGPDTWVETLLKASPVGVGILVDRIILRVNDNLCNLLGYTPEEMIGRNSKFLYPSEEEYERVGKEKYIDIIKTGSGIQRTTFVKKNSSLVEVSLNSTAVDRTDLGKGLVFTVTDMTVISTAEKKQSESIEKFETFFNNVDDSLFVHPYRENGFDYIVEVNDAACRKYGYSRSEFLKMKVSDITSFTSKEEHEARQTEIKKTGSSSKIFEATNVTKSGKKFPVEINSNIVSLGGEKYIFAVVRDISERVSAVKNFEDSERKYREMFELSPEAMVILNRMGFITECNRAFYSMTSMDSGSLIGKHFSKTTLFSAREIPKYLKIFSSLVVSGKNQSVEYNWRHIDGTPRRGIAHVGPIIKNNKIVGIQAIAQDITEKRQSELRINESELLNRTIIQTALDGFLSLNLKGEIVNVNESYCNMTGYTREELIGRKVTDLVISMTPPEIKKKIESILKIGSDRFESMHLKKDGNFCNLEIYARYLELEGGLIVAFLKDITEEKINQVIMQTRLEMISSINNRTVDELLQRSLDITERMTRSSIGFFHFLDSDQKTLSLQAWSTNTLNNMCSAEGKGSHYNVDRAGVWVDAVRERKPVIHNDYNSLKNKQGLPEGHAPVIRELVVPIIEGETIRALIGVGNKESDYTEHDIEIVSRLGDLTLSIYEKKQSEEKLRESNFWLNEAQKISNSGYYIFSIAEDSWTASAILNQILGIDESFNKTLETYFSLIHPDHLEEMKDYVTNHVLRKRQVFDKQYLIRRINDGKARWVHGLGQLVYDDNGNPSKIVGTIRDITDQKLAELDLVRAKEKAEESDRLKSTFLATMSHELRTPLNAVIGFSSLISEEEDIGSIWEMNRYISDNGNRLLAIIQSIFDISMFETKSAKVSIEKFAARELFISLEQSLLQDIDKEKSDLIKMIFEPDNQHPDLVLKTDKNKLSQLITNLLSNAIRYTDKGSVRFGYRVIGDSINIFVSDTGIGIPAEKLEVIFEKFRQVDESITRIHDGVGLGLAICKEIASLLGGDLWVESEVGKGSTFYFEVEGIIEDKDKSSMTLNSKIQIPELSGSTILVAEDVESNYLYLEKLINQTGASVIWVANGADAVRAVSENQSISLVLMDIRMPGMNGFEAATEIKKIRSDLPVIAQTAYAMNEDRQKALESGCDEYLSKPIGAGNFFSLLNRIVG